MNIFKKFEYRKLQIDKDIFQVQFRRRWSISWESLNYHISLESAKECIEINKEKDIKYPRVVK